MRPAPRLVTPAPLPAGGGGARAGPALFATIQRSRNVSKIPPVPNATRQRRANYTGPAAINFRHRQIDGTLKIFKARHFRYDLAQK